MRRLLWMLLCTSALAGRVQAQTCVQAFVDADGDGRRARMEHALPQLRLSDGRQLMTTDARGQASLPGALARWFVIKPAGMALPSTPAGLPALELQSAPRVAGCQQLALRPQAPRADSKVLVFGDPQPKSLIDVDYYARDIVQPLVGRHDAGLGISLGDIVDDRPELYPAITAVTARLGVPWLHVAGNHDADLDAPDDASSLRSFRAQFGPDTFAWEEPQASIVVLDDVIWQPASTPKYIGGLREDQFDFLGNYLATARRDRLLVVTLHIPLFEPEGKDTFRDADRARLFELLRPFPNVLVLSAHNHTQRHVHHDARTGWHGAAPLHEYNVGATCGAYWSGAKDARGIPDATMADGTPNGYATLTVHAGGDYALDYVPAGDAPPRIGLHAPKVLRQGAYPGWGVYANVWMGLEDTRVEFRVDDGAWLPMRKLLQADPALLAENARDDAATALRGYDRSPEAEVSQHLWRGALPTKLSVGEHRVEVRAFDRWRGEARASITYRLEAATP